MSKEIILVLAAILFLVVAVYTINKISKLNISRSYKTALIYITIIIPIVGLFLAIRTERKSGV